MNQKSLLCTLIILALSAPKSFAGAKFGDDENMWISFGAGVRTSFNVLEDPPSDKDHDEGLELDSVRLFIKGQLMEHLGFTLNAEREIDGNLRMYDAIARLEFNEAFNVWLGRVMVPNDRSNQSSPYRLGSWDFSRSQSFPNIYVGRDYGGVAWGHLKNGMFKYQVGAFEGSDGKGSANDSNNLLYAGRATIHFWDPEWGYGSASTYYGEKDILTVGLTAMHQSDAAGTPDNQGDFTGWNGDFLMEKRFDATSGTVSLEGAYYDYDMDDLTWSGETNGPKQGNGYFLLGGYLFPKPVGIGKFRPHVRYERFDPHAAPETERYTLGLSYVMKGHDARVTVAVGESDDGHDTRGFFRIGAQFMY